MSAVEPPVIVAQAVLSSVKMAHCFFFFFFACLARPNPAEERLVGKNEVTMWCECERGCLHRFQGAAAVGRCWVAYDGGCTFALIYRARRAHRDRNRSDGNGKPQPQLQLPFRTAPTPLPPSHLSPCLPRDS